MRARFVYEHINFERKKDSLYSLGIGKKVMIEKWLSEMEIKKYIINNELTIDVFEDINQIYHLYELPEFIQFNIVKDKFNYSNCKLISLKGCPKIVGSKNDKYSYFGCEHNELISLEYCPRIVYGDFYCRFNPGDFTESYVRSLCNVIGKVFV